MVLVVLAEHGDLARKLVLLVLAFEVLSPLVEDDAVLETVVVGVVVVEEHGVDEFDEGGTLGVPAEGREEG